MGSIRSNVYGEQWRSWRVGKGIETYQGTPSICGDDVFNRIIFNVPIDQIANLISNLKTNPDSRRLMVSAWNVGELDQMVLPPCHYGFQVYTRELGLEERFEYYGKHFMKQNNGSHPLKNYVKLTG